jgi:hypothetical protein
MILHERLQDRIERRLQRRKLLTLHVGLTILVALTVVWAVDVFNLPSKTQDVIIPAAVLLLIAHLLWTKYQDSGEAIIRQEIQREQQGDLYEKPKHRMAIDDDGELTEIVYDQDAWEEKPKRAE